MSTPAGDDRGAACPTSRTSSTRPDPHMICPCAAAACSWTCVSPRAATAFRSAERLLDWRGHAQYGAPRLLLQGRRGGSCRAHGRFHDLASTSSKSSARPSVFTMDHGLPLLQRYLGTLITTRRSARQRHERWCAILSDDAYDPTGPARLRHVRAHPGSSACAKRMVEPPGGHRPHVQPGGDPAEGTTTFRGEDRRALPTSSFMRARPMVSTTPNS